MDIRATARHETRTLFNLMGHERADCWIMNDKGKAIDPETHETQTTKGVAIWMDEPSSPECIHHKKSTDRTVQYKLNAQSLRPLVFTVM